MKMVTLDQWDEETWKLVAPLYEEAFGTSSAKPKHVIQHMLSTNLGYLHVLYEHEKAIAMAITGIVNNGHLLIIDYLTVLSSYRSQGKGRKVFELIKVWGQTKKSVSNIIIEVEAEPTPSNLARIRFWEKCGFILTEYIHSYKWVPETYQAMFLEIRKDSSFPKKGEDLFKFITLFHKASFTKAKHKN
ncbi:GNAT family N-acetyltransferase [Bacillus sp. HMF5848]|uniref:GNAT family N-acetyltransferase n=1 Tax=Bacillus sp. HMF5848 TaxID=2495421 RepID=UPI000F76A110|nr:GNAT family N-acetyltransferase [Bacillus sp. HMF5848]RSK27540.1 GNAT family N-acetyltransferase [Bacillus sp. HMF5848]